MNDGSVSNIHVIVPAYRAAWSLRACLDHLQAAGFAPRDITVVDDGSPDATSDIARKTGVRVVRLPFSNGAAVARNAGAADVASDLLFFVDADVLVHSGVRSRIEAFFAAHPEHAGLYGSYDDAPTHPGRVSRIRNLLHHHVHQVSGGDVPSFWTGCGAVRRADFERIGGFRTEDERIEDVGFGMALARSGRKVRLDPDLLCRHMKHWTLRGMAETDLLHRAIPWSRMLRAPENRDLPHRLNTDRTGKMSVVAVATALLAVPLAPLAPITGLALFMVAIVALAWLNRGFLSRVSRLWGPWEAIAALGILMVHYACAGIGYASVMLGLNRRRGAPE